MTITYVATGTDSAANSTSVSVTLPAGITTGDVMILHVLARGTASTISTPAGWTVGPGDSNLAFTNGHRAAWFYRVATSSESAPTVSQSVSALIYAEISAWRGCDTTTPIDIDSVSDGSTAATTFAAPSVTPVSANAMVLWLFSTPDDNTLNAGSQGTTRYSVSTVTGNDGSLALISLLETTATASGTTSLTQSVNGPDNWVTFAFALRPAAVAAADPSTTTRMGYKFAVEMAFGSTPYTPNPVWTDVSADVRKEAGISIQRGRDSEFSDAQPGTCTFTLNNRGRKYDPDYTAGTYYGQLLPMVQVRVRVRVSSTNYTLYTGFVQSWEQSYDYPNEAICVVSCVDLFTILALKQLPATLLELDVLAGQPYSYYPFDDDGIVAADISGHNHSTAYSPSHQALGAGWQAVSSPLPAFTSQNCRFLRTVEAPLGAPLISVQDQDVETVQTLEVWLYFLTFSQDVLLHDVDFRVNATARSSYLQFKAYSSAIVTGGTVDGNFIDFTVGDASTDLGTITMELATDTLYHLVGTIDSTQSTFTAYVNGQAVGTVDVSAGTFDAGTRTPAISVGYLGGTSTVDVAHLAAYTTGLSSTDVVAHYGTGYTGGKNETAMDRLSEIADFLGLVDAGLYSGTNAGDNAYLAPAGDLSGDAISAMFKLVHSEQGRLFVSGAGVLTAQGRCADMGELSTNATSQATISDSGSLTFTDLQPSANTVDLLRNSITVNYNNGSSSTTVDTDSRDRYGERNESVDTSLADPSAAANLAQSRIRRFATPHSRIQTLTLTPRSTSDSRLTTALTAELGYRYTVTRTPQGVGSANSYTVTVEGIQHQFDGVSWVTTFYLVPAQDSYSAHPWLLLGDATYGKIGTSAGNRVPY